MMAGGTQECSDTNPLKAPSTGLLTPVEGQFDLAANLAERRRNHSRGTPSKISLDPELRAFIVARPATLTFEAITRDVASTFPPDRRVSRSSVARWWLSNRQFLPDITRSRL